MPYLSSDPPDENEAVRCASCGWRGKARQAIAVVGGLIQCPGCGAAVEQEPEGRQITFREFL
jgi:hypothetical protein